MSNACAAALLGCFGFEFMERLDIDMITCEHFLVESVKYTLSHELSLRISQQNTFSSISTNNNVLSLNFKDESLGLFY